MDERVAQYLRLYSCLFQTTVRRTEISRGGKKEEGRRKENKEGGEEEGGKEQDNDEEQRTVVWNKQE